MARNENETKKVEAYSDTKTTTTRDTTPRDTAVRDTRDTYVDEKPHRRWQDWVNLLLGAWLFISPWFLFNQGGYATDAYWVGALIFLVSVWALAMPSAAAAEWSNILLGVGLFIAPWVLGAAYEPDWNAYLVGALVAILAGTALAATRRDRTRRTV